MRVWWENGASGTETTAWRLRLRLDEDENLQGSGQGGAPITLVTNTCTVRLPVAVAEPHPDLLALAALLIVRPWTRSRITFDRPISPALAEGLAEFFKIDGGPVDDALPGRVGGGELGLSYSSGVDSIAAAELLDPAAPYLHFQRVKHPRVPNRATHVRADQIARLVRRAGGRGRNVFITESDLEFLCLPWPQYPTWPALALGAVFLADHLRLGGIAFGTVLESAYLNGGRRYTGGGVGPWARLLEAAGLAVCRPVTGLTEVGTLMLARRSELADLAQSCLLGAAGRPCLACAKCTRKELLAATLEGRPIDQQLRRRLQPGEPAAKDLEGTPPLHMQNCIEYVVARRSDLDGTLLEQLAKRMAVTVESTSWNERCYPQAVRDEVPQPWRGGIVRRLRERVAWMTDRDVELLESWNGLHQLPR